MAGSSESKKQLGKILLAQKLVSSEALAEMLEEQKRDPGSRLASAATRSGRITVQAALEALSEQHGLPSVDLTRLLIVLSTLRLIPQEIARERLVLAFRGDGEQLLVAMCEPSDQELIDELAFITSKEIKPYVALDHVLRRAIDYAYGALARGEEYYVGAHVSDAQLATLGLPSLARAPEPMTEPPPPALQSLLAPPLGAVLDEAFAEPAQPSHPPEVPRAETSAQVLIAHRDSELRGLLARALCGAGIAVLESSDGPETLRLVNTQTPSLLVLEACLGTHSGLDVCRLLRRSKEGADLPVIVLGDALMGWRTTEDLRETLGIAQVFAPPLDALKLTRCVRLLLEGHDTACEPPPLTAEAEQKRDASVHAFTQGDLDTAITELEAGLLLQPDAFELQYQLGLLYGRREELFSAAQALERALCLQPQHFAAAKNLAVIYQTVGFRRKAIDAWERALYAAPDEETQSGITQHILSLHSV